MPADPLTLRKRRDRAAEACAQRGLDAVLVGPGADLAYLCGYRISPSERLTCLILTASGDAWLVVPALEAPRARAAGTGVALREWEETEDPLALAAALMSGRGDLGVGDQLWASFLLRLQHALPDRAFRPASVVTRDLRARKDAAELAALRAAAQAADRAYARVREVPFAGRPEREIAAVLGGLLREEGHEAVAFTIVAAGAAGASPHHETGDRLIGSGNAVVLDFGGTLDGYYSDITRTVVVGPPTDELVRVHDLVRRAQETGYAAAREGASAESVDGAARRVIEDGGLGNRFIHRVGHGIGLEGHEHPYLVAGNTETLAPGMAFSIEPGIYIPDRFGVRIEDIAAIGDDGRAEPLNRADHALAVVN